MLHACIRSFAVMFRLWSINTTPILSLPLRGGMQTAHVSVPLRLCSAYRSINRPPSCRCPFGAVCKPHMYPFLCSYVPPIGASTRPPSCRCPFGANAILSTSSAPKGQSQTSPGQSGCGVLAGIRAALGCGTTQSQALKGRNRRSINPRHTVRRIRSDVAGTRHAVRPGRSSRDDASVGSEYNH